MIRSIIALAICFLLAPASAFALSPGDGVTYVTGTTTRTGTLLVQTASLDLVARDGTTTTQDQVAPSAVKPAATPTPTPTATATPTSTPTSTPAPTGSCTKTQNIGESVQAFVGRLASGDVGCLIDGTYTENVSVSAGGWTLTYADGAKPVICGYAEVKDTANDVTFDGLRLDGSCSSQNTLQVWGDRFHLLNSDVTNQRRGLSCLYLGSRTYGVAVSPVIDHDTIHDCGADTTFDHGTYSDEVTGAQITNDVFYNNAAFGIQFYKNTDGSTFSHNVVDGSNGMSGLTFSGDAGYASDYDTVDQNIFSNNAQYGIDSWWGSGAGVGDVAGSNCFWQNGLGAMHGSGYAQTGGDVFADPLYVDRANHNYSLQAGSPCAGMGPS